MLLAKVGKAISDRIICSDIFWQGFVAMLRLRVKTSGGQQYSLTERVSGESTLYNLLLAVEDVTAILPHRQKILTGKFRFIVLFLLFYGKSFLQ